jgi:hypothetical protein
VIEGASSPPIKSKGDTPAAQTKRAAARIKLKDPELLEWIESQPNSLTKEIYLFNDGMVSASLEVSTRERAFFKLSEFDRDPTMPAFIPRSARLKIGIEVSNGLENDRIMSGLILSLELDKETFVKKVAKTLKQAAARELEWSKEQRASTLIEHALIMFELLAQVAVKVDRICATPPDGKSFKELGCHAFRIYVRKMPPPFFKEFLQFDVLKMESMITKISGFDVSTAPDSTVNAEAQQIQGFCQASLLLLVQHLLKEADKFFKQVSQELITEQQETVRRKTAVREIEAAYKAEATSKVTEATAAALAAEPTVSSATLDQLMEEKFNERVVNVKKLSHQVERHTTLLSKSNLAIKNYLGNRQLSKKEKAALQKSKQDTSNNNKRKAEQNQKGKKGGNSNNSNKNSDNSSNNRHQNKQVRFSRNHSDKNGNQDGDNNGQKKGGGHRKKQRYNGRKK